MEGTKSLSADQRRALLKQLLDQRSAEVCPLGEAQLSIWLHQMLHPDSTEYNEGYSFRIAMPVDEMILRKAFEAVVERHAVLNATFTQRSGEPVQLLGAGSRDVLYVHDVAGATPAQLRERIRAQTNTPIDLSRGPAMSAHLYKGAPDGDILLIVAHHVVLDLSSLIVVVADLKTAYEAILNHRALPEKPPQYAGFVRWQRQLLASPEGQVLREYWMTRLQGFEPQLQLARLGKLAPRGSARHAFAIDLGLVEQLRNMARAQNVTLFALLQTAFFVVLHRYTGQTDLVVGTPLSGRSQPEFETVVGDLANLACLRADLSGSPRLCDVLQQVHKRVLEALDHQDYPAPLLVKDLGLESDGDRSPLYSAIFRWEQPLQLVAAAKDAVSRQQTGGLVLTPLASEQESPKVELACDICDMESSLTGTLHYRTDLFDRELIAGIAESFTVLLAALPSQGEQPISSLPLVAEATRQQVLQEWNATACDVSCGPFMHSEFERMAKRAPEAIAVRCAGHSLTYADLDQRSNAIAHALREAGIVPEQLVGLYGDRGLETLIGVLGILKAGGCYVPIGTELPEQRVSYMLSDAQLSLSVATADRRSELERLAPHMKIIVSSLSGGRVAEAPHPNITSGARAYLLYTSGSTGQPKGVQVEHAQVVNLLTHFQREPGLRPDDVFLSVSAFSFDISILELFWTLAAGATIELAKSDVVRDPQRLIELFDASAATFMQATPSYWQVLINAGWNGSPRLRVLTGGEALTPTLADQLLERSREVWNAYGPTETTVYSTIGRVHKGAPIVLGKPIANTQVFVLDHALQPLPFGVQGQICIAGAGLARGYLNRPELTDARFVSALPSLREVNIERLYLTGDLGHYTAQGELACSGRSDHQVKVMGQRIELDEIAVQVGAHPAVAGAVVVLNHDQGAPRLIAYLVQAPGSRLAHEALFQEVHAHLERVLTLAMLPSQYVVLERFPLTPSGKIDRKRLPAPAIVQAARAQHPLEGPTQHTLARCWERVLRIPVSDAKANFFQLGGSSLAAMQVAVEAAKQGVELVPDALFAYPTLEELSNAVELGWTRRDRYQNDPDWLSNPDDSGLPVAE